MDFPQVQASTNNWRSEHSDMAMNIINSYNAMGQVPGCTAIFRLASLASSSPVITSNVAHTVHYRGHSATVDFTSDGTPVGVASGN